MNETKQDLTQMLGVWALPDDDGPCVAVVSWPVGIGAPGNDRQWFLCGSSLMGTDHWHPNGEADAEDADDLRLTERLGTLDDLRRGADVLMQRREYVTAAVVYQLLGDEEGVERAVAKRREQIARDRAADGDKPF